MILKFIHLFLVITSTFFGMVSNNLLTDLASSVRESINKKADKNADKKDEVIKNAMKTFLQELLDENKNVDFTTDFKAPVNEEKSQPENKIDVTIEIEKKPKMIMIKKKISAMTQSLFSSIQPIKSDVKDGFKKLKRQAVSFTGKEKDMIKSDEELLKKQNPSIQAQKKES